MVFLEDNVVKAPLSLKFDYESPSHVRPVCKLAQCEKKAFFLPGHKERVLFVSFTIHRWVIFDGQRGETIE